MTLASHPECGGLVVLLCDLRLDDADELRIALGLPVTCPSEQVLATAWAHWEEEAPSRFRGDFAFALREPGGDTILARDPVGQRLLFHRRTDTGVLAAPSARQLLQAAGLRAEPDRDRLIAYLAGRPPGDGSSFFSGIGQVEPGEVVHIAPDGRIRRQRYWSPDTERTRYDAEIDYPAVLRQHLRRAVQSRLGDGPVATHLSAGLDSAGVTAMAAVSSGHPLIAFTAAPAIDVATSGRLADESALAALLAERYRQVEHIVVRPERHALELLDLAFTAFEQPLPNPANFGWVAAINDAARGRGLSNMLIGQFGNYAFSAKVLRGRRAWLAQWRGSPPAQPPSPFVRRGVIAPLPDQRPDPLRPFRLIDPGNYVRGTERAWGVALRDPLADPALVAFCLTAPARVVGDRGLARAALEGLVPQAILENRLRGYQAADWLPQLAARWRLALDVIDDFSRHAMAQDLLDIAALRHAASALPQAAPSPETERLYRTHFLRALCVGNFIAQVARDQ